MTHTQMTRGTWYADVTQNDLGLAGVFVRKVMGEEEMYDVLTANFSCIVETGRVKVNAQESLTIEEEFNLVRLAFELMTPQNKQVRRFSSPYQVKEYMETWHFIHHFFRI